MFAPTTIRPYQPSTMSATQPAAVRAHVELYIRHLGERPLMGSWVNTMMHAVRGYFRLAHIDAYVDGV